jgi:hypothetical protein
MVSPSNPTTASDVAAVVDGATVVDEFAVVDGVAVPVIAGVVVGAVVVLGGAVVVAAVVAIGAARPETAELAWVSVPAKKYASPLVVAQLATNAPMRAPRAGWRRRLRVFIGPGVATARELE